MKKFLLVLVGAFLIIACHRKVDLETEKTKVKEVLDQYLQMLKTENVDLLSKLTAHDADMVSFGTATNERIVGWEAMKEFMEIQFESTKTAKISSSDQVIKIHNSANIARNTPLVSLFSDTIKSGKDEARLNCQPRKTVPRRAPVRQRLITFAIIECGSK